MSVVGGGISHVWRWCVDAVAPRHCAGCDGAALPPLCATCRNQLLDQPVPEPRITGGMVVRAAFAYRDPAGAVLRAAKYHGAVSALEEIADIVAQRWHIARWQRPDVLVPVPLGPRRFAERGYNQAHVIASALGRRHQLPVVDGLRRVRETAMQVGTDEGRRAANVAGAFEWAGAPPGAVWLVDDVFTTGATARAAAESLRSAGASRTDVVVAARVL